MPMSTSSTLVTDLALAFAIATAGRVPAGTAPRLGDARRALMPHGAAIMHSVQIARPHRVQCTPVATAGWR